MAEIFPNAGLTFLHSFFPRLDTSPATLYLGIFTNFTASTVGDLDCTIGSIVELGGAGVTRKAIPAASWLAAASIAGGIVATAAEVTFDETTGAGTPTHAANGWILVDKPTGSCALIGMSNFTDSAGVVQPPIIVNQSGIVIKVRPAWKRTN